MIPHKIQLKNFLSYGPQLQTIDFKSHDLICLSGKNGHGKSALLDAMTWALWGQGRKILGTAKPDAGLLRLGQTHMLVIFDFEFGSKLYRIRREYMETHGKPLSILEFGLINPETSEFIPLTDKTIRATQAKIEQTLRLDFDAFTNSAFLRQGNSNEFSKKSPKDRKQVLASILGLDQYEVIRKRALEKIKDATAKKTVLSMVQEKRLQELATQDILTIKLRNLEQQMSSITTEEKQWNTIQASFEKEQLALDTLQSEQALLVFQKKQLNDKQTTQTQHLQELRSQWRIINTKRQSLSTVHQLEHDKKTIIAAITEQQKLFQYNLEKKETLLTITQQIAAIEQKQKDEEAHKNQLILLALERLLTEQKNKHNIAHMLEDELKKNALENTRITTELTVLNTQLSTLKPVTTDFIIAFEKNLEKRKAAYQHFVSLGNWINAELQNMIQKKKLVHKDDPSCPLCEQNLSASRRRFLKTNFEKTESFLTHRLRRLKRIIPTLKELLIAQHAQLVKDKEFILKSQELQTKIAELVLQSEKITIISTEITEKHLTLQQEIQKCAETISEEQKRSSEHNNSNVLLTNSDYQTLTNKKNSLETDLREHPYNPELYQNYQNKLTIIEREISDHESFKIALAQQDTRKQEISALCSELKKIKHQNDELQKKLSTLADLPSQISALHAKEQQHKLLRTEISNKKDILLQAKGSIENQQKQLAKIKRDYEQELKNIAQLDGIIDDYQAISTATGKDGIQALLIEEAIPEIEQEANQLLSQLTNNQAQIFIESLRDLKKGGTKETLDIKISDQNGIRPYEMFSGGEAFRIDFALRIAISKLLARRAGTALQTLIIDEGFGSQDEEGLSHIMDALHAIQENFSKIIVVSHLHGMKDQFPVQFVIQKGVQGSMVSVIEQG